MGMDEEWKKVYQARANQDLPAYKKGFWTSKGYSQLMKVTLKLVNPIKSEIKNALDVGCGTGTYCQELSKLGIKIKGIDYTEELIMEAKKKFPNLDFEVGNGYNLNFENKSFDLVISIGALQCLENHRKFIEEICRVSKKYVILSTLLSEEGKDADEHLKEMLKKDSWPTREYIPEDLIKLFQLHGFICKVTTHHEDKRKIRDGFFILAKRI